MWPRSTCFLLGVSELQDFQQQKLSLKMHLIYSGTTEGEQLRVQGGKGGFSTLISADLGLTGLSGPTMVSPHFWMHCPPSLPNRNGCPFKLSLQVVHPS